MLAEAVGGAPARGPAARPVLRPAPDSTTRSTSGPGEPWPGPVAHGYRFLGTDPKLPAIDLSDGTPIVPFTSVVTAAGGAGSIATSAGDLAHWAAALYGGDLLDQATRATRWSPTSPGRRRYKPRVPYGLGVQSVTVDGHPTLGHSGRFLGARAVVRWLPARAHRHRGPDQPEPDGPEPRARIAPQARVPAAARLPLLRRHPLTATAADPTP